MGVAVIISSGLIGILWRLPKWLNRQSVNGLSLFLLGLCAFGHVVDDLLVAQTYDLDNHTQHGASTDSPVSIGTMLLGLIMQRRVENLVPKMLIESKALCFVGVNHILPVCFEKHAMASLIT